MMEGCSLRTAKKWEFFALAEKQGDECVITLYGAPSYFSLPLSLKTSCALAGDEIRALFEEAMITSLHKENLPFFVKDGLLQGITASFPLIGIAKTSDHLPFSLHPGQWFCELSKNEFLVRLHPHAYTPFRIQIAGGMPENLLASLAFLSRDLVFPGYPLGLIYADRFARVAHEEQDSLLCLFEVAAGKDWKQLKAGMRYKNAHSVLDTIF